MEVIVALIRLVYHDASSIGLELEIVDHRRKFYHVGYVDYDKELPANIQIVPDEKLMPAYETDYNEMKENFIYGDALKFDKLLKRLTDIQDYFHSLC